MKPIAQRLWAKVDVKGATECWEWQGFRHKRRGHGMMGKGTRDEGLVYTHRVAWEAVNGPVPDGLWVLHRCDNPPCCNPSHLFLGTRADNIADMVAKGRQARGEAKSVRLTDTDVREIRAATAAGERQLQVARRYGISRSMVSAIHKRIRWAHVP